MHTLLRAVIIANELLQEQAFFLVVYDCNNVVISRPLETIKNSNTFSLNKIFISRAYRTFKEKRTFQKQTNHFNCLRILVEKQSHLFFYRENHKHIFMIICSMILFVLFVFNIFLLDHECFVPMPTNHRRRKKCRFTRKNVFLPYMLHRRRGNVCNKKQIKKKLSQL